MSVPHLPASNAKILGLLSAVLILLAGCSAPAPAPPPSLALWYWHQPFDVPEDDAARLREAGFHHLFVLAGTFSTDGERLELTQPQRWEAVPEGLALTLVFRFDSGATRHLEDIPAADVARAIAAAIPSRPAAQGVQLDIDLPTRLIPRYAEILRALRPLAGQHQISITALPSWLDDPAFPDLARAADFVVPQLYEAEIGETLDEAQPIVSPNWRSRVIERIASLPGRYWLGLPAYGHALLYDAEGKLQGTYRGLSVDDAFRHPNLAFESRTVPPAGEGEQHVVFRALEADPKGRGKDYRILYKVPSFASLRAQFEAVAGARNVQGLAVFRYPEPGESLTLPLASLLAAPHGPGEPDIQVEVERRSRPWSAVEGRGPESEIRIIARNLGTAPLAAHPEALVVTLRVDALPDPNPGDFDLAEAAGGGLRLVAHRSRPGEDLRTGWIRIAGSPESIPGEARTLAAEAEQPEVRPLDP